MFLKIVHKPIRLEHLLTFLFIFLIKTKSVISTTISQQILNSKLLSVLWGPIDLICSNCIGKDWAQYPVPYVQTALERVGPNT